MKTSLREIAETEKYLRGELPPEDSVVFQARLLVDDQLRINTIFQGMIHRLVHLYHRKKVKAELESMHQRLFTDPSHADFRDRILRLFNH